MLTNSHASSAKAVNATHQSVLLYAVFSLFAFPLFLNKFLKLKKNTR